MMGKQEEPEISGSMSAEEQAYLRALEQNVAQGRSLARNAPGSKRAGGRSDEEVRREFGGGMRTSSAAPIPTARGNHPTRVDAAAMIPVGAIITLGDGSIGIFKDPAPGKEYQLVYFLEPGGKISPQGVVLHAYDVQELGVLPESHLKAFQRSQRWNRDSVVFHLKHWDDVRHLPPAIAFDPQEAPSIDDVSPRRGSRGSVPHMSGEMQMAPGLDENPSAMDFEAPHPLPERKSELTIGRRLRIKFGDRDWDAVYWGADDLGAILAHCTNKKWAMMHLDLKRFADNIELVGTLTREEMQEIQRQVEDSGEA
jgi:hypothetical protein